jgi:hypothetical protein
LNRSATRQGWSGRTSRSESLQRCIRPPIIYPPRTRLRQVWTSRPRPSTMLGLGAKIMEHRWGLGMALVLVVVGVACSKDNQVETPEVVCAIGEYSCHVRTLRFCNDSRTGWLDVDLCGEGTRCDVLEKSCVPGNPDGGTGGSETGGGGGTGGGTGGVDGSTGGTAGADAGPDGDASMTNDTECQGAGCDASNDVCTGECPLPCSHGGCEEGAALSKGCSTCTSKVCETDAFCCSAAWDSPCVTTAKGLAECNCTLACTHSECEAGGGLVKECSTCATKVCTADAYCCTSDWDSTCVTTAQAITECGCQADSGASDANLD